jgi:hypothetical protein
MQLTTSDYISIIAVVLTLVGFLIQHFAVLGGMKERIAALETKMEIFWQAVGANVAQMLKSYPTNIRKDILLEKLSTKEITLDESYELKTILKGEMQLADRERIGYVLLIAGIDVVIYELKQSKRKPLWKRCLGY